ncbi:DUF418 domain-containing protein [Streptomyces niveus]|uniref:DUF418 domain-containing protein n=1 Tax=Streptomyces niveus TaxID=193462 RepID=UPI003723F962
MNTTTSTDRATAQEPAAPAPRRIAALDSLRGFALCGILLVNLPYQMMEMSKRDDASGIYPVPAFLDYFVDQRFFPVSRWWLARFRYGPLEWVLRCLTWWNMVPARRSHP